MTTAKCSKLHCLSCVVVGTKNAFGWMASHRRLLWQLSPTRPKPQLRNKDILQITYETPHLLYSRRYTQRLHFRFTVYNIVILVPQHKFFKGGGEEREFTSLLTSLRRFLCKTVPEPQLTITKKLIGTMARTGFAQGVNKGHVNTQKERAARPSRSKGVS